MESTKRTNRRTLLKTAVAIPLCGASLIAQQADAGVDSEELTIEEKTQRIFSTLSKEEQQSIIDTLQNSDNESNFLLARKLRGNASLALMLIYSLYQKDQEEKLAKQEQVA